MPFTGINDCYKCPISTGFHPTPLTNIKFVHLAGQIPVRSWNMMFPLMLAKGYPSKSVTTGEQLWGLMHISAKLQSITLYTSGLHTICTYAELDSFSLSAVALAISYLTVPTQHDTGAPPYTTSWQPTHCISHMPVMLWCNVQSLPGHTCAALLQVIIRCTERWVDKARVNRWHALPQYKCLTHPYFNIFQVSAHTT